MYIPTVIEFDNEELRAYLMRGTAYFQANLPEYIVFDHVLKQVADVLEGERYSNFQAAGSCQEVNYTLFTNKQGPLDWYPLDIMHPIIYVSLVNDICNPDNWQKILSHFAKCESHFVERFSIPAVVGSDSRQTVTQVGLNKPSSGSTLGALDFMLTENRAWTQFQRRSLNLSLKYEYLLQTDVLNCYGSLYTHSIPWALHGIECAKNNPNDLTYLGNVIDKHFQASRYRQTNGICQGPMISDLVIEMVLAFVDSEIVREVESGSEFSYAHGPLTDDDLKILRYQDEYRIFANSEEIARKLLKALSDKLLVVNMKLSGTRKAAPGTVIEETISPEFWASIDGQHMLDASDNPLDSTKQHSLDLLLHIHSFGQKFPNSRALEIMMWHYADIVLRQDTEEFREKFDFDDISMFVAVALDISFTAPAIFPTAVFILSHLIPMSKPNEQRDLWDQVQKRMSRVPNNGHQEVWLQRIAIAQDSIMTDFDASEPLCTVVAGKRNSLWNNEWVECSKLKKIMEDCSLVDVETKNKLKVAMKTHELRRRL